MATKRKFEQFEPLKGARFSTPLFLSGPVYRPRTDGLGAESEVLSDLAALRLFQRSSKCYPSLFILKLMNIVLNEIEARVLGALVEKDITTPDYYPLSLNALVNACNQKNNRDPVMNLEEGAVRDALNGLHDHRLAGPASGADSRVTKYEHRLQETFNFSRERPLFCACCCCAGLRRRESCAGGRSACTTLKIWMRCNPVCRN